MAIPNLFIVGAPKCGTTSLYDKLGLHPDIFCPALKEPCFFSRSISGFPDWGLATLDAYLKAYSDSEPFRYRVDGSTWSFSIKGTERLIKEFNPQAKCIILLRNPIDRAFSSWSFAYTNGWTTVASFPEAVHMELASTGNSSWDFRYIETSLYSDRLNDYMQFFGKDALKIFIFEDLIAHPEAVFDELISWLDIPQCRKAELNLSNVTELRPFKRMLKYSKHKTLLTAYWNSIPYSLRQHIKKLPGFKQKQFEKPTREQRLSLWHLFSDDVKKLSHLLGQDLTSKWSSR
jgi:hypothetical protein